MINIVGEINSEMVKRVSEEVYSLADKGSPPILVFITSGGGLVDAGFDLYDLLKLYPGEKTGLVWRMAKSAAAFVLQACDKRTITPHSRMMIHHISRRDLSLDVLRSPSRVKRVVKEMERMQALMYKVFSTRSGKSIEEIRKACEAEQDLYADEAVIFGLADSLWTGNIPVDAKT